MGYLGIIQTLMIFNVICKVNNRLEVKSFDRISSDVIALVPAFFSLAFSQPACFVPCLLASYFDSALMLLASRV